MYVEYIPGNTNFIFSVAHDGSMNLTSILVRQNDCEDSDGVCIYPGKVIVILRRYAKCIL